MCLAGVRNRSSTTPFGSQPFPQSRDTDQAVHEPFIDGTNQATNNHHNHLLTVRLLVSCTRTWTAELLGLAPPVVCHEQRTVVLHERLLQLVLGILVDVFLVVCHDGLCDGLADGVDLRGVAATGDTDTDVNAGCELGTSSVVIFPCLVSPVLSAGSQCKTLETLEAVRFGEDVPNLSVPSIRMGS